MTTSPRRWAVVLLAALPLVPAGSIWNVHGTRSSQASAAFLGCWPAGVENGRGSLMKGIRPVGGAGGVVMTAENETASHERRPRRKQKESGGPAAHFAALKVAAKNRAEAKRNKEKRRSERDQYLEEMRKAFKLLQIKEREEEGAVWVTRPKRERPQIPLTQLKVGQKYEGTVITVKEFGCYVDFGAKRDGFVRVRDFSNVDFVLDARTCVKPGQTVDFYVKYISPAENIVTGSFFPFEVEDEEDLEARTPLSEVREDDELWGEVTKVSNYGAFLDVGVEVPGFLHVIYYPKKPLGALTQEVFEPGMRLRVWAMEVDTEKRRLKLTAERPRTLPRVDYAWYLNEGQEVEASEPRNGFYYGEGLGLQRKARGGTKAAAAVVDDEDDEGVDEEEGQE